MRYIQGILELDDEGFELRRGGAIVTVEPRVLELIIYLVRNRARLVTKRELLQSLWEGCSVVESAISRCVCMARKAVGDPALIRTIRGRGYRWAEGEDSSRDQAASEFLGLGAAAWSFSTPDTTTKSREDGAYSSKIVRR